MKKQLIQIAIDGPAGSGKSTVAQLVAEKLSIYYLSTGKIFRSYAYALRDVDCKNQKDVKRELSQFKFSFKNENFYINNINVSTDIMTDAHSINASIISAYPFVRKKYRKDLKKIAKGTSIIMDGRDIGTVIIPKTPFKFFLTASLMVRAKRRAKDVHVRPGTEDFKKLVHQIELRDYQDKNRLYDPLRKAKDAILIDSDDMTAQEVCDYIVECVDKKIKESKK